MKFPGGRFAGRTWPVALADALAPDDCAGNWWAMYGDGAMRPGSTKTLVPTGTPTNTVENGWPVRTYTAAQNDQEPANAAFPASDFTALIHDRVNALPNLQHMGFGVSGANAGFVALPFEQQTNGNLIAYISTGTLASALTASVLIAAARWYLLAFTYQRVGDGTSVGTVYVNGVAIAKSNTMKLVGSLSSVWSTNGYAAAASGMAKSTRGAAVTYKALSGADIARISAAVGP